MAATSWPPLMKQRVSQVGEPTDGHPHTLGGTKCPAEHRGTKALDPRDPLRLVLPAPPARLLATPMMARFQAVTDFDEGPVRTTSSVACQVMHWPSLLPCLSPPESRSPAPLSPPATQDPFGSEGGDRGLFPSCSVSKAGRPVCDCRPAPRKPSRLAVRSLAFSGRNGE